MLAPVECCRCHAVRPPGGSLCLSAEAAILECRMVYPVCQACVQDILADVLPKGVDPGACPICGGTGQMRFPGKDGLGFSVPCVCTAA
jgi:hypothetical protein